MINPSIFPQESRIFYYTKKAAGLINEGKTYWKPKVFSFGALITGTAFITAELFQTAIENFKNQPHVYTQISDDEDVAAKAIIIALLCAVALFPSTKINSVNR